MTRLIALCLLLICSISTAAEQLLVIGAKLYKIDTPEEIVVLDDLLKSATLEHEPMLITKFGKEAVIEVGAQDTDGNPADMLKILVNSNETTKTYSLDVYLFKEGNQSISRIVEQPIGHEVTFSTSIGGITRIVKVKTDTIDESELTKHK